MLKDALKNRQETVRNEFLRIFAVIVKNNPDHPIFRPLTQLQNPDDTEADVFENLRHIQKHRVGRAFHRLATLCETSAIPVSTIMQFFFPLATVHLCNDQYTGEKMQGLINAVLDLTRAVSGKLSWAKYEPLLKHFLNMMARKPVYHKQLIRYVDGQGSFGEIWDSCWWFRYFIPVFFRADVGLGNREQPSRLTFLGFSSYFFISRA